MAGKINDVISNDKIDIIQIEHSFLAPYIELINNYSNSSINFTRRYCRSSWMGISN